MRLSLVVVAALTSAACSDAILVEIAGDRPVPTGLDAICVGVADASLGGGHFGRAYRLEGKLNRLPQTLRVEAGDAESAYAWVRGDRGGTTALTIGASIDFSDDVTLSLDRCLSGRPGAPTPVGGAMGPADARLAVSHGAGGTLVLAVAQGNAGALDANGSTLSELPLPTPRAGKIVAALAADLDGDCDDDAIIATDGAAPALWRRDGVTFTEVGSLGGATIAAVASADVDRDGDLDLVTGAGGTLTLWRNDGSGTFTTDGAALSANGRVSAVSALALGDLDGDGNPELVVGQAAAPLVAWLGDPGGTGSFVPADAAVPRVPLDVARLVLADADGDFDPDLVVSVKGGAMRLYVDREGRLEDQSFVRLPQPAPMASAVAVGGWDDGCEPDAIVASAAGGLSLRGSPTGVLVRESSAPAGTDAAFADIDDDGDLDALIAGAQGVTWLAR
ncbi:MAG: VCBS repeat-containing protein [Deltaproteobacteria bacterium]|nr:VCBS repeat-containing protein [Deltaproteobacteria bacterium]